MAIAQLGGAYSYDTLQASAAKTATANGAVFYGPGGVKQWLVQVACTAVSGTNPTLDVKLQHTIDGGTNWNDITGGAFTQLTATGVQLLNITGPWSDACRIVYTIGGTATPTFTFSVKSFARAGY